MFMNEQKLKEVRKLLAKVCTVIDDILGEDVVEMTAKAKGRPKSSCLMEGVERETTRKLITVLVEKSWDAGMGRFEINGITMSVNHVAAFIAYCFIELAIMPEYFNQKDFVALMNEATDRAVVNRSSFFRSLSIIDKSMSMGKESESAIVQEMMDWIEKANVNTK